MSDKICFECGEQASHDHHVIPKSLGGVKTVPLCENHHGVVHDIRFLNHGTLTKKALGVRKVAKKRVSRFPPYGFKFDKNDNLLENKREQEIIEKIKDLVSKGIGATEISKIFRKKNILNRNKTHFSPVSMNQLMRKILNRTEYYGEVND